VNDELERMRKEAAVAQFKVLSRHLAGGTEENYEEISVRIVCLQTEI
jgi:hypothetical protein